LKAYPTETLQDEFAGMDLRDYFAIHANCYDIYKYQIDDNNNVIRTRAEARYAFADAMMEEREK
jgi:hypothetical protein